MARALSYGTWSAERPAAASVETPPTRSSHLHRTPEMTPLPAIAQYYEWYESQLRAQRTELPWICAHAQRTELGSASRERTCVAPPGVILQHASAGLAIPA